MLLQPKSGRSQDLEVSLQLHLLQRILKKTIFWIAWMLKNWLFRPVEWVKEYQNGLPNYNKLLEEGERHPIEETGQRLRSLMPWIPKKNIKGAQASYS